MPFRIRKTRFIQGQPRRARHDPSDAAETATTLDELDARMPLNPEHETLRCRWMLRLLLDKRHLNGGRHGVLRDDWVLEALGLDYQVLQEVPRDLLQRWIARRLRQLEQTELAPDTIGQNARWLADWLGLTEVQRQVLVLAATVPISGALECCLRPFGSLPTAQAMALVAKVLGVPVDDVRASLSPQSQLIRSGLVEFQPARDGHHESWIAVKSPFDDVLAAHHERPDELFSAICPHASAPELELEAFSHMSREVQLLTALLRGATLERSRAVNVLLHGAPGTGKSQLVRALAKALGLTLHQVPDVSPDGKVLTGEERLAALGTMQYLLEGGAPGLVLFDEIEDAFPWSVEGGWMRQGSGTDKARTNRLLEENAVPCVWVGNRVGQLDAAYVRRFSLVLELTPPPRQVRERLLQTFATGLDVPPDLRRELAEDTTLMPADMARAASVTQLVRRARALEPSAAATGLLDASSSAQPLSDAHVFERALRGSRRLGSRRSSRVELAYDPTLVKTSVSLQRLIPGLKRSSQGCVCLYGPPGTGKTAFARQLALALERPLLHRSAGDLLDKYVGGTEQAIAEMFEEASRSDSVLFLDEAEGLMRNRASATHGFEVTMVNELLVRMEAFRGIFLCATNAFDSMDPASLRRFSLRIEFLPLDADQNLTLLARTAVALGLQLDPDAERLARRRLASLTRLTPGDHAAVLHGRTLLGEASIDALLGDLERAQAEKRQERRIGFRG